MSCVQREKNLNLKWESGMGSHGPCKSQAQAYPINRTGERSLIKTAVHPPGYYEKMSL